MYLMVTSRCNMKCLHCGMACTSRGRDMSLETFKQALTHVDEKDQLEIGGGEPTLHPLFWDFLGLAICKCNNVWLATNGKITPFALRLARMARDGIVAVELSQDPWHEKIDSRVVNAFTKILDPCGVQVNDKRGIRNTSKNLIKAGRSKQGMEGCICEGDPFVKPDGLVYQCGCKDSPCVGDVWKGFDALDDEGTWECWKNTLKSKKVFQQRDFVKEMELEVDKATVL